MASGAGRDVGRNRILRQAAVIEPEVELVAHGVRSGRGLRVEDPVPQRRRQQHHVVGRRLQGGSGRHPDRLEQLVGVRQIDDSCNPHRRVGLRHATDRHRVADPDMQVRRRLLGNQDAVERAEQQAELRRKGRVIGRSEAEHLPGARHLHGPAGRGFEPLHIRVVDPRRLAHRRRLARRVLDRGAVGAGEQLHLPVHGHGGDRALGHRRRARAHEGAERGEQRHRERHARRRTQQAPGTGAQQPQGPQP